MLLEHLRFKNKISNEVICHLFTPILSSHNYFIHSTSHILHVVNITVSISAPLDVSGLRNPKELSRRPLPSRWTAVGDISEEKCSLLKFELVISLFVDLAEQCFGACKA
ncbi:unnamed protein product [Arctia plantaginis]|uniref:Uncharacterized protein n=1 Tax=Arctia plantaginis TaxID=874455 RepID=A0A8S1BAP3_ARCPL|nr:unnamed protein product [Arctia plantaginis]